MQSLIAAIDAHMTRQRISLPRSKSLYPSAASVRWVDEHGVTHQAGACMRAEFWRLTGTGEGRSESKPSSEWVFALGKAVEEILVEQVKQMGLWVTNNLKYYDELRNISGEIDLIVDDGSGPCIVEIKSFYGYFATKELCGTRWKAGRPKDEHLLQLMLYLDLCGRRGIADRGVLLYYARDSSKRAEFDIRLEADASGKRYASIDGVVDTRFSIEDVYERYALLQAHVASGEVPPRDFQIRYTPERLAELVTSGDVSKTALAKHESGEKPAGDWRCSWCQYKDSCWGADAGLDASEENID